MERAAQITAHGGPDAINWIDVDLPPPSVGEVRMRNTAVGLNFIDTYHRRGIYRVALPSRPWHRSGRASSRRSAKASTGWKVGDRVCCFGPDAGRLCNRTQYRGRVSVPHSPMTSSDETRSGGEILKGCTTEFLVERCAKVQPKWNVLVHAAAGGVGLMQVQWLKHVGANVIGTVSTGRKSRARSRGRGRPCHPLRQHEREDVAKQVRLLTDGRGVEVVFDGIGMATWETSLDSATAARV